MAAAGGEATVFVTGKRLAHITAAHQTALSPDGRYVSFIRDHGLWIAPLNGRKERPLAAGHADRWAGEPDPTYAQEFSLDTHYWWSPDAKSIAFVETEFPAPDHVALPGAALPRFRLKIVEAATGSVRTVAESDDEWAYLLRVAWHPDSRRLAYYRMNRLQTMAELRLDGRTLVTEKDAYWVNAPETPLFLRQNAGIVISSDRSGYRHVYLCDLAGRFLRDLTPPDLEIYRLHRALDPQGAVYVSGSAGDRQQQHLYRLDLAGGPPKQITREAGWHEATLNATGAAYLDSYSTAARPPALSWHGRDGRVREITPRKANGEKSEFFTIETHDHTRLPARVFRPPGFDPGRRYPVIVYTFSGPRGRVVRDAWGDWRMDWNRRMVALGYVVLAVDVRGSGGYGHRFEEPVHYQFGAQETSDLREVVSYLRQQSYVDPARLGIWGSGHGAHTVVHAMLSFPGGFKAGLADSPVTDWRQYNAYFSERYLGLPRNHVTEYAASSPLENAGRITGNLLVALRPDDPFVRPVHSELLRKAMAGARSPEARRRVSFGSFEEAAKFFADRL